MKYMIHCCEKRLWYVNEFLVPAMLEQGLPKDSIIVQNDELHRGCLRSYIDSFRKLRGRNSGTWHLQDDVIISHDFAKITKEHDDGIVYGFFFRHYAEGDLNDGLTPVLEAGYSFPCIRIPDDIAAEFAEWFLGDAQYREHYERYVKEKKYVDVFWRDFLKERYTDGYIYNLKPSIVEHVDWLIGGSTINKWRDRICRATYWKDEDIIEDLKERIAHRS